MVPGRVAEVASPHEGDCSGQGPNSVSTVVLAAGAGVNPERLGRIS